ncbi:TPA: hypothetical protein DIC62_01630 [Candidatus Nomurabacteria bacterium]|nr:hypothetical protein [Candidatus Nomurabacteria bacterium]
MSYAWVTSWTGKSFSVNTSDEACAVFGFKSGDRIISRAGGGIVIGVAPATEGPNPKPDVLWYAVDGRDGKVSYSDNNDIRR